MKGKPIIQEVCVTGDNDWTWPVAKLRINGHYTLISKDWPPGEKRCYWPSNFIRRKYGCRFRPEKNPQQAGGIQWRILMKIESFEIIVMTREVFRDLIGVWGGQ